MYFSRKARGDMSYERQVERWCRMDSMVWRGCWRVTRRYFCSDRLRLGKTAWAASYGLSGCFRLPGGKNVGSLVDWIREMRNLTCWGLSHPSDVSEGLLGGRDQPGPPLPHLPLVFLHVVISLIVTAGVAPLGDIAHNRRIAVLRIYNLALVNLLFIGYKIIKLNSSNIILWLESPALPIALIEFHLSEKVLQSCSLMV